MLHQPRSSMRVDCSSLNQQLTERIYTHNLQSIAMEIAADEVAHVVFLRFALGKSAVAMPLVRQFNY